MALQAPLHRQLQKAINLDPWRAPARRLDLRGPVSRAYRRLATSRLMTLRTLLHRQAWRGDSPEGGPTSLRIARRGSFR
jgi:hypothetical protein